MRLELLIALLFVVHFQVVEGFANERPSWIKHPGAFRASPALKMRSFGPYQFATHWLHGHLAIWCRYILVKDGLALFFEGTAKAKTALFIAQNEVLPKPPLLNAHQNCCD
jgi:hypothetical protein